MRATLTPGEQAALAVRPERSNPDDLLPTLEIVGLVAALGIAFWAVYRQVQGIGYIASGLGGAAAATGEGVGSALGNTGGAAGQTFSAFGSGVQGAEQGLGGLFSGVGSVGSGVEQGIGGIFSGLGGFLHGL